MSSSQQVFLCSAVVLFPSGCGISPATVICFFDWFWRGQIHWEEWSVWHSAHFARLQSLTCLCCLMNFMEKILSSLFDLLLYQVCPGPIHSRSEGCDFQAWLNVSDITTMDDLLQEWQQWLLHYFQAVSDISTMDVLLEEWQQGSLCFIISRLNALLPGTLNQCHSYYTLKFNPGKLVLTVNRLNAESLRQRRLLLFEHEVMRTWDQKPLLYQFLVDFLLSTFRTSEPLSLKEYRMSDTMKV